MPPQDPSPRFVDYIVIMLLVGVLQRQCTLQETAEAAMATARSAAYSAEQARKACEH